MSRSLQEPEAALSEPNLVSVLNGHVRELRSGTRPKIDVRSGTLRKFAMSRDKVGMDMGSIICSIFHIFKAAASR
jgi:hypothetical protein